MLKQATLHNSKCSIKLVYCVYVLSCILHAIYILIITSESDKSTTVFGKLLLLVKIYIFKECSVIDCFGLLTFKLLYRMQGTMDNSPYYLEKCVVLERG